MTDKADLAVTDSIKTKLKDDHCCYKCHNIAMKNTLTFGFGR